MQPKGNKYGTHRVISPKGVLPQPADKIDNNMDVLYDNEILIDVQTLNIDSASLRRLKNRPAATRPRLPKSCSASWKNRASTATP